MNHKTLIGKLRNTILIARFQSACLPNRKLSEYQRKEAYVYSFHCYLPSRISDTIGYRNRIKEHGPYMDNTEVDYDRCEASHRLWIWSPVSKVCRWRGWSQATLENASFLVSLCIIVTMKSKFNCDLCDNWPEFRLIWGKAVPIVSTLKRRIRLCGAHPVL
jgi:hypothetical protein